MSNYFSIEIIAPQGLISIEPYLSHCLMALSAYRSQYHGKTILKAQIDAEYELSMDANTTDTLFAAGEFYHGAADAIKKLQSLSDILAEMNFPHQILIDDESGLLLKTLRYQWP
jgi:hypothetical protein